MVVLAMSPLPLVEFVLIKLIFFKKKAFPIGFSGVATLKGMIVNNYNYSSKIKIFKWRRFNSR
jgi:hypothetical protein